MEKDFQPLLSTMRSLLLGALGLFLAGCPTMLSGRVNAVVDVVPPQHLLFTMTSKDSISLRERTIVGLIEKKLSERGFVKASSPEVAIIAVHYQYSLGSGTTDVSSSQDFVFGGQKVSSSTSYPRTFDIAIIDIEKSKTSGKVAIIWQGALYSKGSSADMTWLAPYFIDVLFEHYGKTVTNQTFTRVVD
jgi:hypothetical protein